MKDSIQEDNKNFNSENVELPVKLAKNYNIDELLSNFSLIQKVYLHGNRC